MIFFLHLYSVLGAIVNCGFNAYCLIKSRKAKDTTWRSATPYLTLQLVLQVYLSVYTLYASHRLGNKVAVNPVLRLSAWLVLGKPRSFDLVFVFFRNLAEYTQNYILGCTLVVPVVLGLRPGQSAGLRLTVLYSGMSGSYLLLSQSWEVLFLINYAVVVAIWMESESVIATTTNHSVKETTEQFRSVKSWDAVRALTFLFLVHAVSLGRVWGLIRVTILLCTSTDAFFLLPT